MDCNPLGRLTIRLRTPVTRIKNPHDQPVAQSLDAPALWAAVRDFLARRFGHGDYAETERMSRQLEVSRDKALTLAGDGADNQVLLTAYWAGYLDGMLTSRPDIADAVRELPGSTGANTFNNVSGIAEKVVQARDVDGGITVN